MNQWTDDNNYEPLSDDHSIMVSTEQVLTNTQTEICTNQETVPKQGKVS